MEITQERSGAVLLLTLQGSLNPATAEELERELLALIESGERQLVLDLSQVDYVCSSGLRVLLRAFKQLSNLNGKMTLHSLRAPVFKVFEVTGLATIFRIFSSREDALDGVGVTGMLPTCLLRNFEKP